MEILGEKYIRPNKLMKPEFFIVNRLLKVKNIKSVRGSVGGNVMRNFLLSEMKDAYKSVILDHNCIVCRNPIFKTQYGLCIIRAKSTFTSKGVEKFNTQTKDLVREVLDEKKTRPKRIIIADEISQDARDSASMRYIDYIVWNGKEYESIYTGSKQNINLNSFGGEEKK